MKKIVRSASFLMAIAAVTILSACQKDEEFSNDQNSGLTLQPDLKSQSTNTFYGPTVPMGGGVARAWVTVNKEGDPKAVGINLSEKALTSLPADPTAFVLLLPPNKGKNFYKHVLLDWNPLGHEPAGTYDVPHFDFHFYTISSADRLAMVPLSPPAYDTPVASQYVPSAYLQLPGIVPAMGAHWIDLLSPEISGGSSLFTKTFIWGSYQGAFVFWEPMITLAYLNSHPNEITPIRQPAGFQQDGWYPQNYKVSFSTHPKEYTIALLDLEHHEGE